MTDVQNDVMWGELEISTGLYIFFLFISFIVCLAIYALLYDLLLCINRLSTLEFIIRAEAPIIQAATFDRSFCYVNVLFNTGITGPKTCSDLFHQTTLNLLGTGNVK